MLRIVIFTTAIFSVSFANNVFPLDREETLNFTLTQDSRDKNRISKPALIQYTDPKDKNESYLIDAAFKAVYAPGGDTNLETTGLFEVHKNTLVDKEQDTLSLGFMAGTYLKQWNCVSDAACTDNLFGDASISYQKDNENRKESVLAIFELSGTVIDLYLNHVHGTSNFPTYWSPTLGLEYENFIKSNNAQEGSLGRLYANIEFGIFPFFNELEGRLALSISHSHWTDFSKSEKLGINDDSHQLNSIDILYQITPEDSDVAVSVSLSWLDGENPRTKKIDQEYTQFGIGVKF